MINIVIFQESLEEGSGELSSQSSPNSSLSMQVNRVIIIVTLQSNILLDCEQFYTNLSITQTLPYTYIY